MKTLLTLYSMVITLLLLDTVGAMTYLEQDLTTAKRTIQNHKACLASKPVNIVTPKSDEKIKTEKEEMYSEGFKHGHLAKCSNVQPRRI